MNERKAAHLNHSELWEQWKEHGDKEAKKQLIEKYLHIVEYVSGRLAVGLPKNVSKDDLASNGVMGLIDALEKFDYERGLQFETYASWRVRGAILDGLRQGDWVPRSVREKAKKIEDAYQHLEQRYLRTVSDEEMSHYLDVSEKEFQNMIQEVAVMSIVSLEDPIREEESETRLSLLVDEKAKNPDHKVNEFTLRDALAQGIDKLTEKERIVVSLLYYEDLSLSEIAEVMSLSPSRISQLHSKAILRLRATLDKQRDLLMRKD
ncbi:MULTISPECIES: FliA/WhiG family RNA polymerase sigma factor [Paenibacillus]|jgi:RNA polymerase sigma factor for flagellar operon FliA|uniref:FliA/WhiG family RNA polymerase sigma factor n=5 Tax=Paenibacillus TaxID=44249 RepID=A0A0D7X9W5_9BACL|nr:MULTISPECIES: FliA/WhiG family RNA polymerase sigma factor [Paenibacillus]KAF6637626.1 FliA/WhiG family RNA polymerase sigma factor [Paenibacillus sp. EKM208P]ADM69748.1 RNA polymerase sigma factor SigD [Paenibacillus polymyxa E681]AET60398.1 RNA polymerase sigma-D factor (Sigma-28) [Paenibacillus terrae HPL-003]AHC19610.1 RNA polymerase sigma factor SigD [Paenibacillus polymyxa CR1]ALA41881.1 RNA polymerase sigma factor SigD [Paenibacillus peoriae]